MQDETEQKASEAQAARDLTALSALAFSSDGFREAKLGALKAQYDAGSLSIDPAELAKKLVEDHLRVASIQQAKSSSQK